MQPNRTALLIIDLINDFSFPKGEDLAHHTNEIIPGILKLKKYCYDSNWPVIYVNDNHGCNHFMEIAAKCDNSLSQPIIEKVFPGKEDYFICKTKFSGFYKTKLSSLLKSLYVDSLIITGVSGDICVLFTASDAYMREYKLIIPADGYSCNTFEEKQFMDCYFKSVFHADTRSIQQIITT